MFEPLAVELRADPSSVPFARHLVADALARDEPSPECVDAVLVVVTELVTNAVRYGRAPIQLSVTDDGTTSRIDVIDRGDQLPTLVPRGERDIGGLGLHIVEGLASSWGAQCDGGRTRVWAEITRR